MIADDAGAAIVRRTLAETTSHQTLEQRRLHQMTLVGDARTCDVRQSAGLEDVG